MDYTNNSEKKDVAPEKDIQVPTAHVNKKVKEKKFADLFLAEDISSVKEYIIYDLIIPAAKRTIVDFVVNTTQMLFYGKGKVTGTSGPTNYTQFSSGSSRPVTRASSITRAFRNDELIFDNYESAKAALDEFVNRAYKYRRVSISTLYEIAGLTTSNWTYRNYGWDNADALSRCDIYYIETENGTGCYIDFPRPIQL